LLTRGEGVVKRTDDALFFHRYAGGYPHSAIRVGDFKLIKIWKTGALELYNLQDDLGERNDLSAKLPAKAQELHAKLMDYFKRVDAEVLHGYGKSKPED